MRDFLNTFAHALRVIFHGNTLDEFCAFRRNEYFSNPHRNQLFRWEQMVKALRNKQYDVSDLSPEMQLWCSYPRKAFFIQLWKEYQKFGYQWDVERLQVEAEKGTATVVQRPDGSETTVDDKKGTISSAVVKQGITIEF